MELQRAKELLTALADGIDPLTGEVLPQESVCNRAEIVRALHCVLNALPDKPHPENMGKPWTEEDDAALCRMYDAGVTREALCAHFKRSRGGIVSRLAHLGKIEERGQFYFPSRAAKESGD